MSKTAKIFLAEGFEESEALTPYDILKRGGVNVALVSVTGQKSVTSSHGVTIEAQELIEDYKEDADLLMLPGGMPGSVNLSNHEVLCDHLVKAANEGKIVSAICAAPFVLGQLGLLEGKNATVYPGFEDKLTGAKATGERVVRDGNIVTGIGPGASLEFGLALLESLTDAAKVSEIKKQMIVR